MGELLPPAGKNWGPSRRRLRRGLAPESRLPRGPHQAELCSISRRGWRKEALREAKALALGAYTSKCRSLSRMPDSPCRFWASRKAALAEVQQSAPDQTGLWRRSTTTWGCCSMAKGDLEGVHRKNTKKAIALDPDSAAAHGNLGIVFREKKGRPLTLLSVNLAKPSA